MPHNNVITFRTQL